MSTGGQDLDPTARHAKALLALARSPNFEGAEVAIQDLEDIMALESSPPDAKLANDLAAAYFVRAQRGDRLDDLLRGLESVERALEIDPNLGTAQFNRGLICDAIGARECARESWTSYRRIDADSDWSREATRRLDRLNERERDSDWPQRKVALRVAVARGDHGRIRPLVQGWRRSVREWIEIELLPNGFAAAWTAPATRPEDLAVAEELAATLADLNGDRLPDLAVQHARSLLAGSDAGARKRLANGLAAFAAAEAVLGEQDPNYELAGQRFARARIELEAAESPLTLRATLGEAECNYQSNRRKKAKQSLTLFLRRPEIPDFPSLEARALHIQGSLLSPQGKIAPALSNYDAARFAYLKIGDRQSADLMAVRSVQLRGNSFGFDRQSWSALYRALPALDDPKPTQRFVVRGELLWAAQSLGCNRAADRLYRIDPDREQLKPAEAALYWGYLSNNSQQLGRPKQAAEEARRALESSSTAGKNALEDTKWRIEEVAARIALEHGDANRAAEHLQAALKIVKSANLDYFLVGLETQLAEALLAGKRGPEAIRALKAAVADLEWQWRREFVGRQVASESVRSQYFDLNGQPIALLVDLLAEQGDFEAAFKVSEIRRAREILDLLARHPISGSARADRSARTLSLDELEKELPQGESQTLVSFSLREDHAWVFLLDHKGLRGQRIPIGRQTLREETAKLVKLLRPNASLSELQAVLGRLHQALITPWLTNVAREATLVIIPDQELHTVPFSALWNEKSREYLVETHAIAIAPSASLWARAVARNREIPETSTPSILAVGNPTFDAELFPDLAPLYYAAQEAEDVARGYLFRTVIEGPAATPGRVFGAARGVDVVHLAVHALTIDSPPDALLILAKDGELESGQVRADDLLQTDFGSTRLLFLAACSSAGGEPIGAQGAATLVRALLGAGVPAVVGTLWPIDDDKTQELAAAFHYNFRTGANAAEALRQAQIKLIRRDDDLSSPRVWGGFAVIGSAQLHSP